MFACLSRYVREHADDVSCLHKQCAQRYVNTYVDRQVGKSICPKVNQNQNGN